MGYFIEVLSEQNLAKIEETKGFQTLYQATKEKDLVFCYMMGGHGTGSTVTGLYVAEYGDYDAFVNEADCFALTEAEEDAPDAKIQSTVRVYDYLAQVYETLKDQKTDESPVRMLVKFMPHHWEFLNAFDGLLKLNDQPVNIIRHPAFALASRIRQLAKLQLHNYETPPDVQTPPEWDARKPTRHEPFEIASRYRKLVDSPLRDHERPPAFKAPMAWKNMKRVLEKCLKNDFRLFRAPLMFSQDLLFNSKRAKMKMKMALQAERHEIFTEVPEAYFHLPQWLNRVLGFKMPMMNVSLRAYFPVLIDIYDHIKNWKHKLGKNKSHTLDFEAFQHDPEAMSAKILSIWGIEKPKGRTSDLKVINAYDDFKAEGNGLFNSVTFGRAFELGAIAKPKAEPLSLRHFSKDMHEPLKEMTNYYVAALYESDLKFPVPKESDKDLSRVYLLNAFAGGLDHEAVEKIPEPILKKIRSQLRYDFTDASHLALCRNAAIKQENLRIMAQRERGELQTIECESEQHIG